MHLIILICILTTLQHGVESKSCADRLPRQNIDPSKMDGSWYLALHTEDAITSNNVKCIKIGGFTPVENGWELTVTNFHDRTSSRTDRLHFLKTERVGIYKLAETSTERLSQSQAYNRSGILSETAKLEDQYMNTEGVGYITDYKNFYIHVSCKNEDELLVWAMSPRPFVTASEVVEMVNALIDHGISEILQLGHCDQM